MTFFQSLGTEPENDVTCNLTRSSLTGSTQKAHFLRPFFDVLIYCAKRGRVSGAYPLTPEEKEKIEAVK
jgi:hypothetical protein